MKPEVSMFILKAKKMKTRTFLMVVIMTSSTLSANAANFQGVGDLPGGTFSSKAYDVSSDGSVVGFSVSSLGNEAFIWENGTITGLGDLPGGVFSSLAFGISSNNSVIVGSSSGESDFGHEAFRWENGTMTVLTYLPGISAGLAWGVSADGSVVVGRGYRYHVGDNAIEAICWENGTLRRLGYLSDNWTYQSEARAVSADGSVIVGFSMWGYTNFQAFRWENGTMVGLGDLPGGDFYSKAYAVSADGSVVAGVSSSSSGYEAFRWENGTMIGLGDLPGGVFASQAWCISDDGSIVVGRSTVGRNFDVEVFIWDANNGMRNLKDVLEIEYGLDLTGWKLEWARGISQDGSTIVGFGINPDGNTEGWVATLFESVALPVDVDIKPGSCPNPVNVKSHGVLTVAVLGSEDLDASAIVATSVRLGEVEAFRDSYDDVAGGVADANDCSDHTSGPDGYQDLVLKFKTQDIVQSFGEVSQGDILTLNLTGVLEDETPIEGQDCIVIVGKHKPINKADVNQDGSVNAADMAIVAQNWLSSSIVEDE